MNKTVKYSISIFVLILVVTGIYSTYLLSGKGLTLDLFKERILTKYQLDSKVALDDISGIKLKFNRQNGIFLEIQKIELRSIFFSKSISLSDSLVDFKIHELFSINQYLDVKSTLIFSENNVYEVDFNIKTNDNDLNVNLNKFSGPNLYLVNASNFIIKNNNKIIIDKSIEIKTNFKALNKDLKLISQIQLPKELESFESWTNVFIENEINLSEKSFQENLKLKLSGILNFSFLIPEISQEVNSVQTSNSTKSLGVFAIEIEADFLEKNNLINLNLFTNGELDMKGSKIKLSKDYNNAEFDIKTNGTYKLSNLFTSVDIDTDNLPFYTFKRFLNNNSVETNKLSFSFKASDYLNRSFIESISDLKINSDAFVNTNLFSNTINNPSKLAGKTKINIELNLNSLKFDKFKSVGSVVLDDLDIFYRPFNFSKPKGQKLEIFFEADMNDTLKASFKSNENLFLKSELEITKDKNIIVSELFLNNFNNMDLSLSGNIHKRVFNGKVSGELIDFSALKVERKKKNKFFFDQENYEISVKKAILEGGVVVDNFLMTINQKKEKLRVKGQASTNGHDLFYLREKNKETDTSQIQSTDIISFIGDNHPFKKILSRGDAHIKSSRESYSSRSSNYLKFKEFTLINTPAALKLLTLPSLSGISNLIENEDGINFLNGEVTYIEEPDSFSDIEMFGVSDSIGLVMEGSINRKEKTLSLDGEISPIHLVNMLLKKVPIIGDLLVGEEGEGLFAFEFEMRGDTSDPEVSSNPLSIAKPQILERASDYLQTIE